MARQQKMIAKKLGRPATGKGQLIGLRLQPRDLEAVDRFAGEAAKPVSRPQAIRAILSDWLATHGFLKRSDHTEPTGPATDAVRMMDDAIKTHRGAKKPAGSSAEKSKGKRTSSKKK